MRSVSVLAASLCIAGLFSVPALAESRVFIVANQPDGYGIDRCLSAGERCGVPAAQAFCESHDYSRARDFHRITADDVTASIPQPVSACDGGGCAAFVTITCER